jgi:hypothetical protein
MRDKISIFFSLSPPTASFPQQMIDVTLKQSILMHIQRARLDGAERANKKLGYMKRVKFPPGILRR